MMTKSWVHGAAALAMLAGPVAAQAPEQGTGPYPALFEARTDLPDHVVYRPANLTGLGREKLGIYVWGNGGCSADGTGSRNHLLEIASHGYLVIAAGTIPPAATSAAPLPQPVPAAAPSPAPAAQPAPPPGQLTAATATHLLVDAIDWAQRENDRAGSPLKGHIATHAIAVSGWSCGGLQALSAAQDPRVKTAVIMNSGFFPEGANPIGGIVSDKKLLATLHTPILYVLGGPTDIAYGNGTDDFRRITTLPAALINVPVGHGGTYMQPHGGVGAEVVTAWLDWQLKGNAAAGAKFTGADCGFCRDSRLTIERKNIR
jgi:dienelactone hydrolase